MLNPQIVKEMGEIEPHKGIYLGKIKTIEQELSEANTDAQRTKLQENLIMAKQDYFNFLTDVGLKDEAQAYLEKNPEIENLEAAAA